ncbi:MAG TPA: Swt1 family HEPN domain-containing protein [Bryobacteraceae bacterium]|nr:Swt1 family HEPN domain-containing protein [Bryobacteraceae bacterium]
MAITNTERVGRGLDQLKAGLGPFVERELKAIYKNRWVDVAMPSFPDWQTRSLQAKNGALNWDVQALISVMLDLWKDCFQKTLGPSERTILNELRDVRNKYAHQKSFSTDDAYRALDSVARLLTAISASEASSVEQMKAELLRLKFEEQIRGEKRKEASVAVEGRPAGGLKPWRDIITPHPDVASGRYAQAEFAADLWQVYLGEGSDEYRDPIEFYRRTFITEGLQVLLKNAIRRLSRQGGDPVVELQTNFGGGKTHSMLALYHLFAGVPVGQLPGMETVAGEMALSLPTKVNRAVLVGNRITPGKVHRKKDGTEVRTLWGELAWQLGGKQGYEMVRHADEACTSPGDELRELLKKYSPCLILVDEWIAYTRQLYGKQDILGGTFDVQFTFVQSLTEAAKLVDNALLVASIPASKNEIGGEGGEVALAQLKNLMQRVAVAWRPASAEESFEIVRRRLFQHVTDPEALKSRDLVIRSFLDDYRKSHKEFPEEATQADYERRMQRAYPVHPELFDRLYTDWASLEGFQRTRGVLRLMSSIIHQLWIREDKNLLILPASVPVDAPTVQEELIRYLPQEWKFVIEKDIDGPNSLPLRLDRENPVFGRFSACRRVARTLYIGSAPTMDAAKKGIEDRRIKLGCFQPGETSATFGDALRKLYDQSTYLYQDGSRYWYSTQASVARLAQERAAALSMDQVIEAARQHLKEHEDKNKRGDFARVQVCPASANEVLDEPEARLVILGPEYPHAPKQESSPARLQAVQILEKGGAGRNCGNMLVFLAADQPKWPDLEQAIRLELAWESIVKDIFERKTLNVDMAQADGAKDKLKSASDTVRIRLPECYQWLLVPGQRRPVAGEKFPSTEWQELRLQGQEPLAVRASKRLVREELLFVSMGGPRLRAEFDQLPALWRGDHVGIKQLIDDFAKYLYLPRVKNAQVILDAIQDGIHRLTWRQDTFAYADSYDAATGCYRGLSNPPHTHSVVRLDSSSVVVKPEVASAQIEKDLAAASVTTPPPAATPGTLAEYPSTATTAAQPTATRPRAPRRFHGVVDVDATRLSRDVGVIAESVVQHLTSLLDAKVSVTIEINAEVPSGAPDNVVRTVTENCRTLKFENAGFEEN